MGDIAALSEKVLVMHKGRMIMEGTPRQVFSQAEKLASIGLHLPPALQFTEILKQRGIELPGMPLTIEEAEREIAAWIGKK